MSTVTPHELAERIAAGETIELIDVRTPLEYRRGHIDLARNVPLDRLQPEQFPKSRRVYVICQSGRRGRKAVDHLTAAGVNAVNVDGGTSAWEAAGLPVTCGATRVISLERQVRIAAGLLVVTGVLLGYLVHPGFHALSALVGGGLLFAGVSDTCGMGLLLARMPWNCGEESCAGPTCTGVVGNRPI